MLFKKFIPIAMFITSLSCSIVFLSDVASAFLVINNSLPTVAPATSTTSSNENQISNIGNHDVRRIHPSEPFLEGTTTTTTTATMGNIDITAETSTATKTIPKQKKKKVAKITKLNSAEDYMDFLLEDDRLCMVKFYAPTCKSCQKMGMHYKRIGKEIGDLMVSNVNEEEEEESADDVVVREGEVRLAEIDYSTNRELCQRLGVTKLPSIHIYSEGSKVDGFPCGPKKLPMLLSKLSDYRSMSPIDLSFEAEMNQGMELGETVLEALDCEVQATDASSATSDNDCAFC